MTNATNSTDHAVYRLNIALTDVTDHATLKDAILAGRADGRPWHVTTIPAGMNRPWDSTRGPTASHGDFGSEERWQQFLATLTD